MAGIVNPCGFHLPNEEVPMLQARTLPLPNQAPSGHWQHLQAFAASSKQRDQQGSRSIGIPNILNPVDREGGSDASSARGSPRLSKPNISLPLSSRSEAQSSLRVRSSPYRQASRDAPHSQAQNCERTRGISTEPPQPASQRDSPSTQYSSYSQISQTESVIATVTSTGQPLNFPSWPLPGPSSTMLKMPAGTKAFEPPTSNIAAQSQHQMMLQKTEQGSIQVPVDVQVASKVKAEKRQQNASASQRFRQRRKEQKREDSEKIAKLEAQVKEAREDRDYCIEERDYFRNLMVRHHIPITPRPPSPWSSRDVTIYGASLIRS